MKPIKVNRYKEAEDFHLTVVRDENDDDIPEVPINNQLERFAMLVGSVLVTTLVFSLYLLMHIWIK
jgi:hypothetical protein